MCQTQTTKIQPFHLR